ncbi:uncharacterized protein [Porites lutea]|uniref:uncharacterized protein n=1 Tax=Porites lutea TaxID=51062 RepID=UPI003CC512BE
MLHSYGNIISTKAVLDDETKKGYGFVDFESSAEAQKALKALRRRGFHAQMAKQQGKDPTNLCFLYLPMDFDEPKLEAMLRKYGKVQSTRILRDSDNMNKMVGFARMENTHICKQIIEDFNGEKIEGNVRSLVVKFADLGPRDRQKSRKNHADSSCSTNGQGGRPFYEETHEDDELFYGDESCDSVLAKRNPYRTAEAHPFLRIAFNLGMLGLAKLAEKGYGTNHGGSQYRRAISSMCRLVCYLVKKQWLTEAFMEAHVSRSSKQNRLLGSVTANPGCSQLENGYSQSASKESSCDSCFLQDFVSFLINNVDNPMWLFEVLKELGDQLCIDIADGSLTSLEQKQNFRIKSACQGYPPVNLLLQKDLDAFSKLLLGPQMADLVARVTPTRDRLTHRPSKVIYRLRQGRIYDTRLQEVLQIAKRAFSISDSSGAMFKNLTDKITTEFPLLGQQQEHLLTYEMANKHSILEQLLEQDSWDCFRV